MPRPTGYTDTTFAKLTGVAPVDSLISGYKWESTQWYNPGAVTSLTYSFIVPGVSVFAPNYSADNEPKAAYALTDAQQQAVMSALDSWSAVANLTFQLTGESSTSVGDLRFGGYALLDSDAAAWAYTPSLKPNGGDVWIGPNTSQPTPNKGTYDFMTFVHEIGHALGLKHSFAPSAYNSITLDPSLDDAAFTVMSYNNSYSYLPTTPMVLDILAIQSLYGANTKWMTGDNVYSWAPTQSVFETIWDAGGIDTIDASNQLAAVSINLNEGQYSKIGQAFTDQAGNSFNQGLAIAYGAKIENAYGSAFNDTLIGNALDNTLNGGAGADTLIGGAGNDSYVIDNVGDVIIEEGPAASDVDSVYSYIDYTLGANLENLNLVGNAVNATGNSLNNTLRGTDGNNVLDGGAGADVMIGGLGNDTYIVDNSADVIIETSTLVNEIDTVRASANFTLSANLENLYLTGTGNIYGIGNAQNNLLVGNDGNNQLVGGAGLDTMIGGKGNDAYGVDQVGELALIQEFANEGTDLLVIEYNASAQNNVIDLNQASLLNIEDVAITGAGGFTVYGNALNNTLTGNSGDNTLNGGAGADIMIGGAGNDSYVVDNIGDVVIEQGPLASEIDSVYSYIDYTLGANLENLNLVGGALNATGNSLNNILRGNDNDNRLIGGAGLDTMIGGKGNDTYGLDQAGELALVQELANEGNDTLLIGYNATAQTNIVDLNLGNLQYVENVQLTGSGGFTVYGNALSNTLIGNSDDNTLNGGAGADTLIGGAGNDSYVIDNIGDVVIEEGPSASDVDSVYSYIDYTLGANLENLNLVGNAIKATGNSLNNILRGTDGNNVLDGGAGADLMIGGLGNDTYIVDNVGDVISETNRLQGGIDTVRASVSYSLSANLENLTLTGTGNIYGIGNDQDNIIIGNDGNNQLVGGAGVDTLIGGKGDDAYGIDDERELDLVQELANEGTDMLVIEYKAFSVLGSTIDLNRTSLQNIENVALTGSGFFTVYGNALNNTLVGNSDDNTLNGGAGADIMQGGAGNDSYVVDNVGDVVIEDSASATEIDSVYSYIDYTLGANLENLNLVGGAIRATGNSLNNILRGTDGNNILDGGAGADIMIGGAGDDTYIVDNIGDVVTENYRWDGTDTVRASVNYTLGQWVENLTLTGNGNIYAIGNEQNNVLIGNDGDNQLVGGAGLDTMIGGKGNDAYGIDQVGELALIQEFANEGTDLLVIEYDSSARSNVIDLNQASLLNIEDVAITGAGGFTVYGNALNNTLTGNSGDNTLNGGAGADIMIGGAGNDSYVVDNIGDVVIEQGPLASEIDSVYSYIDYTLGANLENLNLVGGALNATGNSLNNILRGNDNDNRLIGGAGLDTMIGGKGNDTYGLDQAGELALVQEKANEGNDTLLIGYNATAQTNIVDLNLGNLQYVENVQLTGSGGFTVYGNALSNTLIGNSDDNTLNGGAGADTLIGGAGNDSYVIDNIGDVVIEEGPSASDVDSVYSYIDYTLGANLENLNLVGNAIKATGNSLNNILRGNAGNNILDGGAGADVLFGDAGADTFVFRAVNEMGIGANRDIITDFNSLQGDKIDLTKFDANLLTAGVNGFTFIGGADFTGAGQLRFVDHILSGNVSGNAGADFEIQLVGVNSFSANDLVA
ncbi:M10 family metallopeptidase C-terminal domain-containing protein [Pseudomonas sp. NMS19W]|uniref:M10 family metallopeptidase C-terminal domain-containing protein n=1 Tax=Pseudomonas sp. NMS19W TaxID=3079768 RepID=UPI003F655B47